MSVQDNWEPIEPRHVEFSRALVALARQHGVRSFTAQYYGGTMSQPWTKINLSWSEGRHGAKTQISLRAEAIHHCTEIEDPDHAQ